MMKTLGGNYQIDENVACGNNQNDEDQEEKSKQVIKLIFVNSRKNKEQFDKNGAKGQHTANHD